MVLPKFPCKNMLFGGAETNTDPFTLEGHWQSFEHPKKKVSFFYRSF